MKPEIPMWLCVIAAINEPELVKEFDRLKGTNLSQIGSPIELLIDETTGRLEHDFNEFIEFVRECIYERVNQEKDEKPFAVHKILLDNGAMCELVDWEGILPGPDETLEEWIARSAGAGKKAESNAI